MTRIRHNGPFTYEEANLVHRCTCPEHKKALGDRNWAVVDYRCNYSAFNGYRHTWSDYSYVTCLSCRKGWRTKAKYVDDLTVLSKTDRQKWAEGDETLVFGSQNK